MKAVRSDLEIISADDENKTFVVSNKRNMDGGNVSNMGWYEPDKIRSMTFPRRVRQHDGWGTLYTITKIDFVDYGYTNLKEIKIPKGCIIVGAEKYNVTEYE